MILLFFFIATHKICSSTGVGRGGFLLPIINNLGGTTLNIEKIVLSPSYSILLDIFTVLCLLDIIFLNITLIKLASEALHSNSTSYLPLDIYRTEKI